MDGFTIWDELIAISHELSGVAELLSFKIEADTALYHEEPYSLSVLEDIIRSNCKKLLSISEMISIS